MKILFLGDIVGKSGRQAVSAHLQELKASYGADVVIANGENAAGGAGIDPKCAEELYEAGVELLTTGNHIWKRKEILPFLDRNKHRIVRPMNYYAKNPGAGSLEYQCSNGVKLTLVNVAARVFMAELADCPFAAMEEFLGAHPFEGRGVTLVDIHGEATSEKVAFARFLDGKVSAVVGTHTHVQTADEQILPKGTAYISDAGMCGAIDSVIGVESEPVIERFLTGQPTKFDAASGKARICGVLIEISEQSRLATKIERIRFDQP